jgi:DNA (cytosine-5)-methyltransferase 1
MSGIRPWSILSIIDRPLEGHADKRQHVIRVVDLFAGAGGFSLGAEMAGCWVSHAVEIDSWACATLRRNHQSTQVVEADIRCLDNQWIRSQLGVNPDIIVGGPPCQGFSHAGPAIKDPRDPRNSLFRDFLRVVHVLQPSLVVMENVPGILRAKTASGEEVHQIIMCELENFGYRSGVYVLEAHAYGVPQIRKRVFFLGSRVGAIPSPPPPSYSTGTHSSLALPSPRTVRDAISDLPIVDVGDADSDLRYSCAPQNEYQRIMREGAPVSVSNHRPMRHTRRLVERFMTIQPGQSQSDVSSEHAPKRRVRSSEAGAAAYDQNNRRMHWDRPCHTLAASFYANFLHPELHRNFTPREGARIQSFPDRYVFEGKATVVSSKLLTRERRFDERYLCQYSQIGNAVPPMLASQLIAHLVQALMVEFV